MDRRNSILRWVGAAALGAALSALACGTTNVGTVDAGGAGGGADAGVSDAGAVTDAGADAGEDGGTDAGDLDGGDDGGTPDAGTPFVLHAGPPMPKPHEIVGPAQGLSTGVTDASHDFAGNLWAVSASHVFVRRAGMGAVEGWAHNGLSGDEILSVSGGLPGVAWIGYKGEGDGDDGEPTALRYTGGVAKVQLNGADIDVTNLHLVSPPGTYSQYPNGRYKLRTCYRAYATKTGPHAGDAWFGCNHGTGLVYGPNNRVLEHHHPGYCDWHADTGDCTLHTGDVPAVAFTSSGDVWFGGTYGVGLLDYDNNGKAEFWGPEPVRNLPLWTNPAGANQFGSQDIVALAVAPDGSLWAASAHNGLAHRKNDGSVELLGTAQGLPTNDLMDLAVDGAEGLWVASATDGVFRIDLVTGEVRAASGLPSNDGFRVVYEPTSAGPVVTVTVKGGVAIYPGNGAP